MIIEELKIEGVDEAIQSFERLTAAINAASAALDVLGDRHGNVSIKVVGSMASVEIKQVFTLEGMIDPETIRDSLSTIDRDG